MRPELGRLGRAPAGHASRPRSTSQALAWSRVDSDRSMEALRARYGQQIDHNKFCSALPHQKTELLCICAIPWISR
jgi:hypothetical protein